MAKLIVTRPRVKRFGAGLRSFRIVVDGRGVGWIDAGKMVEIELPSGHHQVRARLDFLRSQPVNLDFGAEEIHTLRAIGNPRAEKLFRYAAMLPFVVLLGLSLGGSTSGGLRSLTDVGWLEGFAYVMSFLPPVLALLFLRDDFIALDEIPSLTLIEGRIAALLDPQPLRFKVTIRRSMIAVAILAVFLWIGIGSTRHERSSQFRISANLHASLEELARDDEQHYHRMATTGGNIDPNASSYRKKAAKAAANADYHAAMNRKYEVAVARGAFSVEPDPPEPPWP